MKIIDKIRKSLSKEKEYVATKCKHKTKLHGCLEAFGEKFEATLNLKDGKLEYCHDCFSKMAIQCAWCKRPIFPGHPITLYTPKEDFEAPNHAVVYNKDPLQLVGCLMMDCAMSGADRAGFWVPPGEVFRVLSPIEQAMATGDVVIVGDLSDMNKAIKQTRKTIKATEKSDK